MNILNNFGFDPMLFTAQIINFVVILFVLKKFMYKPILDTLKKRQDEIKKGLSDAEEGHKLLADAQEKETKLLQKAQAASDKMISDAKLEAANIKQEAEISTKKETERMILQARQQIEEETKAAEDRLTQNIGQIAVALLEKSLVGIFGKEEQKTILKKASAQLKIK